MEDIATTDRLVEEVRQIARDDVSGATDLTMRAADLLLWALAAGEGGRVAEALLRAKPMMASLLNLATLASGETEEAVERVRAFRDGLSRAPVLAARQVVEWLSRRGHGPVAVRTLSASRVVEETFLALQERGMLSEVVVAESRPRREGAALAERLAALFPRVAVTHDAALPGLCTSQSVVLLGADAVLPDAFVNKSGSLPLCLAAREVGATRLVVTTSHKVLLPEAASCFRTPSCDGMTEDRQHEAVFLDIQFERVPRRLVEAVVTEDGPLTP